MAGTLLRTVVDRMNLKKSLISFLVVTFLLGCGYTSKQNELTGQVKKVVNQTPIFCDNRVDTDLSLGVLRNGVGSMSTQDLWLTVPEKADQEALKKAASSGRIVKVTYNVARFNLCWENHIVTHVELVQ